MPARHFPIAEPGRAAYDDLLAALDEALDDPDRDDNIVCRDLLATWYYPGVDVEAVLGDRSASPALRAALANLDPRNGTLESEYYLELDPERFYPRKPLIWLWMMFDRSPLGHNVRLGVELRRLLARRCFKRCGENVRIFRNVEFTFGYNLSVGDDVVLHHHVFLDDRGELIIEDGASLSDYANVYSHHHDVHDIHDISLGRTVIGAGSRLTYHSTVLSGVRVGRSAMVGAHSVASKDVPDHTVSAGLPARPLRVKDTAPFDDPLKRPSALERSDARMAARRAADRTAAPGPEGRGDSPETAPAGPAPSPAEPASSSAPSSPAAPSSPTPPSPPTAPSSGPRG